jgi:hypothetical protein
MMQKFEESMLVRNFSICWKPALSWPQTFHKLGSGVGETTVKAGKVPWADTAKGLRATKNAAAASADRVSDLNILRSWRFVVVGGYLVGGAESGAPASSECTI